MELNETKILEENETSSMEQIYQNIEQKQTVKIKIKIETQQTLRLHTKL